MSIRMYEAYSIPIVKLREAILLIREIVMNRLREGVYKYLNSIKDPTRRKVYEEDKRIQASRGESGIQIYLHEDQALISTAMLNTWGLLELPEWAVDICYWNNAGAPSTVSEEEWDRRDKIWNEALVLGEPLWVDVEDRESVMLIVSDWLEEKGL